MAALLPVLRTGTLEADLMKKAALNLWENWPEYLGFIMLFVGFLLAITSGSAVVSYILILLFGLAFGRGYYRLKNKMKHTWFVLAFCTLAGFLIGTVYGDRRIVVLLFVIGVTVSYYLHDKKIVSSKEY